MEYLGRPYKEYIRTTKNGGFCEEFLSENNFGAVLANFCCFDNGANASEAVQKIVADEKGYTSGVAKKMQKLHRKRSNNSILN